MQLFLAILPFLIILVLSVGLRWPLWRAGLVSYGASVVIWLLTFDFAKADLLLPLLRGTLVVVEIGLILFGAIGFLEFLKSAGRLDEILSSITSFASDLRVRALLLLFLRRREGSGDASFSRLVWAFLNSGLRCRRWTPPTQRRLVATPSPERPVHHSMNGESTLAALERLCGVRGRHRCILSL